MAKTMPSRPAFRGYELAAKMQLSIPRVADLNGEPAETLTLYGADRPDTADFGRACLLARRLLEQGVRFVQLYSGGTFGSPRRNWDGHEDMKQNHGHEAARIDRPVAGLLRDLRRRGLLDDTLVLCTTEFGRTPFTQSAANVVGTGRDHNQYGFPSCTTCENSSPSCGTMVISASRAILRGPEGTCTNFSRISEITLSRAARRWAGTSVARAWDARRQISVNCRRIARYRDPKVVIPASNRLISPSVDSSSRSNRSRTLFKVASGKIASRCSLRAASFINCCLIPRFSVHSKKSTARCKTSAGPRYPGNVISSPRNENTR